MRILIVATQIRLPGEHGGTTHVGELVRHLKRYGKVLVLAQKGSQGPDVVGLPRMRRVPGIVQQLVAFGVLPRALAAAKRFRPDVIYERGSSYGLGALLKKLSWGAQVWSVSNLLFDR